MANSRLSVPDHVVDLGEDRVFAVDHGIGRRALLGEMDHGFGFKGLDRGREKVVVGDIADKRLDGPPGVLLPDFQSLRQGADGVRVSTPSSWSHKRREKLSTMATSCPLADRYRAVAQPQ
jgi:hypothetical protein